MLSRSLFPYFGQGPFPKIAEKAPVKSIYEHAGVVIQLDWKS